MAAILCRGDELKSIDSKVHGANMGPPGSCRPQVDPMLAQWTLLSGNPHVVSVQIFTLHGYMVYGGFPEYNQQQEAYMRAYY